jgi:hypothetical protein
MDSILDANKVNGLTNWRSQMITMNSRTQAMFNDNALYPYLNEGVWYKEMPNFIDPKNLFTTQLANLKTFALATVDTGQASRYAVLPNLRLVNTATDEFIYPDWPIPVDLSYSDADLKVGGTSGFPIGDLNWFPAQKATWLAQRIAEYNAIEKELQGGIAMSVKNIDALPAKFTLDQNYPNPFNPSTTITFSLPHSANASLIIFDMLGREVATLVNGYTASGTHEVQFNATNLASGFYSYKLTSGNFTEVKKMMLIK